MRWTPAAAALGLLAFAAQPPAAGPAAAPADPASAAPASPAMSVVSPTIFVESAFRLADNYTVEIDNPYVRIVRVRYGPLERLGMHEHAATGPLLIVPLTDEYTRVTLPGGQAVETRRRAGAPIWLQDGLRMPRHAVENLANQPAEQLWIEIRGQPRNGLPAEAPAKAGRP